MSPKGLIARYDAALQKCVSQVLGQPCRTCVEEAISRAYEEGHDAGALWAAGMAAAWASDQRDPHVLAPRLRTIIDLGLSMLDAELDEEGEVS